MLVLIPGMGMCAPMRYTASRASVNKTRFRKSSMRNMFFTASMNRFMLFCATPFYTRHLLSRRQNLKRSSGGGNLFFCRRAERMRVNGNFRGQLTIAQNLDAVLGAANKSVRAKQVRRHRLAGRKNVQLIQVDHRVRNRERIMKSALGHPAMQRHLPAFKSTTA